MSARVKSAVPQKPVYRLQPTEPQTESEAQSGEHTRNVAGAATGKHA